MMLQELILKENGINQYFSTLKDRIALHKECMLFGAGSGGCAVLQWLQDMEVGIDIQCFIDNNPQKWGGGY